MDRREIQGREFAKQIRGMKEAQKKSSRSRRTRVGQGMREGYTTDGSYTRSKMVPVETLNTMSVNRDYMLYTLWEIVRRM